MDWVIENTFKSFQYYLQMTLQPYWANGNLRPGIGTHWVMEPGIYSEKAFGNQEQPLAGTGNLMPSW